MLQDATSFDEPEQRWMFTSDYAVQDYSGDYEITLLPCTVLPSQTFGTYSGDCTPREALTFVIPIEFQQTNQPVATKFQLGATFFLLHNIGTFLDDPSTSVTWPAEGAYSSAYDQDDRIYGRVTVNPDQALGPAFQLKIRQVYLCTGRRGYVPTYEPDAEKYGCLQPSQNLQYRFKLLDLDDPTSQQESFSGIAFDVKTADLESEYTQLSLQNDDDGFSFSAASLYSVVGGYQWYTQVVYRIASVDRRRRDGDGIVSKNSGTGLMPLKLEAPIGDLPLQGPGEESDEETISVSADTKSLGTSSSESRTSDEGKNSVPMYAIPLIILSVFVVFAAMFARWISKKFEENKKRYMIYSEMPINQDNYPPQGYTGQEKMSQSSQESLSPEECEV
jgi:hypothetical protein